MAWALLAPPIALVLREPRLLPLGASSGISADVSLFVLTAVVCGLCAIVLFRVSDHLSNFFSTHDLWPVCWASVFAASTSALATFVVSRLDSIPRSTPVIYGIVLFVGLAARRLLLSRQLAEKSAVASHTQNPQTRKIVLIGIDRFAAQLIRLIESQVPRSTEIVAGLDRRTALVGRSVNGVKIIGVPAELRSVIAEYEVHGVKVDEVWVADTLMASDENVGSYFVSSEAIGVRCLSMSNALNLAPVRPDPEWAVHASSGTVPLSRYFETKRIIDIVLSAILLVMLAPVAAVIAAFIAVNIGPPVIFWQKRTGQNGRRFMLYKFRTFRAPFNRNGSQIPSSERLSRVGRAIRATRLDEIPQLINILRGEMSLIGPRPLLPVDQPNDPRIRLQVRPGVTGWAQINGGNLVTPEEKDALDVWYIRNASFRLDLKIVLGTLTYFLTGERRDRSAIDEAMRLRESIDRIERRMFPDQFAAE